MGVVLPMYAIGIVIYLIYTLSKVNFSTCSQKRKRNFHRGMYMYRALHRASLVINFCENRALKTCFCVVFVSCYRPQTKFAKVMFLQVSVCPQGGHAWLLPGGACVIAPGVGGMHGCSQGGRAWFFRGEEWLLPGGVRDCSGGCVIAPGGGRACFFQGGAGGMRRIRLDTVNERPVRILLECILVKKYVRIYLKQQPYKVTYVIDSCLFLTKLHILRITRHFRVGENHTKCWKSQGIFGKCYLLFLVIFK